MLFFNLECSMVIHSHCQSCVPPMCGVPYKPLADVWRSIDRKSSLEDFGPIRINPRKNNHLQSNSRSSSYDLSWLEPIPIEMDVPKATNVSLPKFSDFHCWGLLGGGYYANVFLAEHKPSKQLIAIKIVDSSSREAQMQIEVEKQVLFRYSHKNPYMVNGYCSFVHGVNSNCSMTNHCSGFDQFLFVALSLRCNANGTR